MEYDQLMKGLGESLEIEDFEPGENGLYSLNVDDTLVVFDKLSESGLMDVVAKICDLPEEGGGQICSVLLSAMAPGGAAEAFTFFIGADKGIYLRRTEELSRLDVEVLRQNLESFANALDEWRTAIDDFRQVIPDIQEAVEEEKSAPPELDAFASDGFIRI